MGKGLAALAAALMLCGYAQAAKPDEPLVGRAKAAILAKLKDPDSARFSDVGRRITPNARGEPTEVVCGRVNSRNSFGGYTGPSAFVYIARYNEAHVAEGEFLDVAIVKTFCRDLLGR